MSVYPPPTQSQTIFNPYNYSSLDSALTIRQANNTYLIKTGADTDYGTITMKQPVYLADGTFSAPSLSFDIQKNLGIYRSASNTLGFSTNGTEQLTISSSSIASILKIECDQYRNKSGFGTAGNVMFGSSNSQGLYFGLNQVSVSTNSSERLRVIDTRTIAYTPITLTDASSITPSIHFNSSVSTGIYYGGANQLALSSNGIKIAGFDTGGLKLYGSTAGNNALYVPSGLQYYEELGPTTMTFTFGANTQTGNIYLTRIGRIVNFHLVSDVVRAPSTTITQISTDTAIPLRFRPVSNRIIGVVMIGDGAGNAFWFISIETTGNMTFVKLTTGTSGTHSVYAFSTSWSIV